MIETFTSIWEAMPPEAWAANAALAVSALLLGGLIFNWWPAWRDRRRVRTSDFSGEWENILHAPDNSVAKRDTLKVYQRGPHLFGTIKRDTPISEKHREFDFQGYLKADRIVATYWATNDTVNRAGSWHVRQVGDGYYSGLYVTVTPDNKIVAKRLDFRRKYRTAPDWLDKDHARLAAQLNDTTPLSKIEFISRRGAK